MRVRRDKRGRRIGRNRWREYVTDTWRNADHTWWCAMESATALWPAEVADYRREHPRPMLRDFMLELSDVWHHTAAA